MKLDLGLLLFQLQSTAPSNIPDEGNAGRENFWNSNFSGPPVFTIHNQADILEHKDNQLPKYEDLFPSTQININTEMK